MTIAAVKHFWSSQNSFTIQAIQVKIELRFSDRCNPFSNSYDLASASGEFWFLDVNNLVIMETIMIKYLTSSIERYSTSWRLTTMNPITKAWFYSICQLQVCLIAYWTPYSAQIQIRKSKSQNTRILAATSCQLPLLRTGLNMMKK